MSEIGSGGGSSYPSAFDTDTSPEVNDPNAGKTRARAEVPNDLAACVITLQQALGLTPQGTALTVKDFLQTEHGVDGTHDPAIIVKTSGNQTIAGVKTYSGTQVWAKGADIASASTLNLGADGNYFDITGTTTIAGIASMGIGTVVRLQFDDALQITHSTANLILPNGANITTKAGDVYEFVEYASADWICTGFSRVSTSVIDDEAVTTTKIADEAVNDTKIDRSEYSVFNECIATSPSGWSESGTLTVRDAAGGIVRLDKSGAAYARTSAQVFDVVLGTVVVECRLAEVLASGDPIIHIGLNESATMSGGNNSIVFEYNTGTSKIKTRTTSASVSTQKDTDVDLGASMKILKIIATATQVDFYVDGVLKTTHTTDIPTLEMYGGFGISASATEDIDIDYWSGVGSGRQA